MPEETPEIMTIAQLCGYLQISRPIAEGFIQTEELPFFTLTNAPGSRKRFKKSLVDKWAEKRSCPGG